MRHQYQPLEVRCSKAYADHHEITERLLESQEMSLEKEGLAMQAEIVSREWRRMQSLIEIQKELDEEKAG